MQRTLAEGWVASHRVGWKAHWCRCTRRHRLGLSGVFSLSQENRFCTTKFRSSLVRALPVLGNASGLRLIEYLYRVKRQARHTIGSQIRPGNSRPALTSETAIDVRAHADDKLERAELRCALHRRSSVEILNPAIEGYLHELLPQRDAVLSDMELLGKEKGFPIIGPLVGRLLCQLTRLTQARHIFELGSGYGYSAVWFSKGLSEDGKIISTDGSPENARLARQFFERAGIAARVDFRVGDALSLLEQEPGPFDIILNDIDKHEYPQAFEKAVPKLRKGGLLITDNVLWHGRVVSGDQQPSTLGVLKFNEMAYHSDGVYTTIIPLRDGVAVTLKL